MRTVVTARDIEELVRKGGSPSSLPKDAIYTPSAQDLLRALPTTAALSAKPAGAPAPQASDDDPAGPLGPPWVAPKESLEAFFARADNHNRKEQICDVGRRLWAREYVDGNGGNISIRVGDDLALCTPTLVSKGFIKPADICMVDLEGNQKAGRKKRTSEILMHLQIMKAVERCVAVVHCHPPYATAFAAIGNPPPNNILPEFEVFIGEVPVASYDTPGTPQMGAKVAALATNHNTILMANHGVVSWSHISVEDAYFKMEILEAYCRTLLVTTQLGKMPNRFTPKQMHDLLSIKQTLGVPDPRIGLDVDQIKTDDIQWRPGVSCMPASSCSCEGGESSDIDPAAEEIVRQITETILRQYKS